jgi:hypothetical protein
MNCADTVEKINRDLTLPGIIFSDINETLWTVTTEEQRSVGDRILDFQMRPDEPPVAAQFLCAKLYLEFGMVPQPGDGMVSSAGYASEVVSCARHMYEHHYDVMFALEYIFQDKTHFLDTFGKKKRWPFAILIESFINYGEPVNENDCSCRSLYSPCCFNSAVNQASGVGMMPLEPPDVAGWVSVDPMSHVCCHPCLASVAMT